MRGRRFILKSSKTIYRALEANVFRDERFVDEGFASDVGKVIIDRLNDGGEHSFLKGNHLFSPEIPGAIEAIAKLRKRFGQRMYTLSKAQEDFTEKTERWFEHHGFYTRTGITAERTIFCSERSRKADICQSLKITHVVDDRIETMINLVGIVPHLYLFENGHNGHNLTHKVRLPSCIHRVHSWSEIQALLLPS